MIQANELRIGNVVTYNKKYGHQQSCKIETIGYTCVGLSIGMDDWKFSELEPIPLTEEWLGKTTFKDRVIEMLGVDFEIQQHFADENIWFINYDNMAVVIKFVHQLQNLYFALTGEELEIKL